MRKQSKRVVRGGMGLVVTMAFSPVVLAGPLPAEEAEEEAPAEVE